MEVLIWIYLGLYLLSGYLHWKSTRILHSKGGIWEGQSPTGIDFIATFIPVMNSVFAVLNYSGIWGSRCKTNFFNNFFKIK